MEDPQRCLLFVPGSRQERFEKAFSVALQARRKRRRDTELAGSERLI